MERTVAGIPQGELEHLLSYEAWCLDHQRWDDWLALFLPEACFWVPSWRSEHEPVRDPRTEASLIHAGSRDRLAERVRRIQQGKTPTAQPLPRTLHIVTNALPLGQDDTGCQLAGAGWTVQRHDPVTRRTDTLFGRYEYGLRRVGGQWRIARKVVYLLNDCVPTYIDFHSV